MHLNLPFYPLHDFLWGSKEWAMCWSSSARPAQLTSADRPVVCRWSCASPHQRKPTSANRLVVCRWSCALLCAGRQAPVQNCACALVVRLSSSAGSLGRRAISGVFFKTTSLHLWPLYICHFVFRSIKRVHIHASYLGYFSRQEKYTKNSFLITQTLFHDHQSSSSIILDHLDVI